MASEQGVVSAGPVPGPLAARPDLARLRPLAVALAAALAGLSYAWALGRDPLEPYYAAAVRSMSMSWHNFVYGAFDPAGTITLDKLPGAFWVQALAVRAFGVHTWVIVAAAGDRGCPHRSRAVPGSAAAGRAGRGPDRHDRRRGEPGGGRAEPGEHLRLAHDLAAGAGGRRGVGRDRRREPGRLVLAAVWVGLAFQAKMIEAWLVLPAFGLAYLAAAPGPPAGASASWPWRVPSPGWCRCRG